ncbi:MAG: hypothetical protein WCJ75_10155 [Desulfomonile sp.]
MQDDDKTKEQLIDELDEMRRKTSDLESALSDLKGRQERFGELDDRYRSLSEFKDRILSASPVGILTYRSDGQCVSANEAAALAGGATTGQLMAQNFRLLESWKKSGLLDAAEKTLASGTRKVYKCRSGYRAVLVYRGQAPDKRSRWMMKKKSGCCWSRTIRETPTTSKTFFHVNRPNFCQ